MSLTPRLDLRQAQSLTMTPRLQQAIRLLQMSALEVEAAVGEELEKNPFLEREGDSAGMEDPAPSGLENDAEMIDRPMSEPLFDSPDGAPEAPPDTNDIPTEDSFYEQVLPDTGEERDTEFDFSMDAWSGAGGKGEGEPGFRAVDLCAAPPPSLHDELTEQIRLTFREPSDRRTALFLLEQLDENARLPEDLSGLVRASGRPAAELERILKVLQGFSPAGVFARSLAECFALQLKEKDRLDPAMAVLLEHLDLVAARDYRQLSKLCGVDGEDIADMIRELRRLSPHPAAEYGAPPASPLIPDVLLRRDRIGNFIVELNQAVLPRLLINRSYAAEISALAGKDREARKFLGERLTSANWLIKALNQRAETILKVSAEIVERQKAFFTEGEQALRPMVLKDVAEAVGMHESTVSRVTAGKYIASPRGIFELKYFFSQALESADGDEARSAQAVRYRIRALIEAEKPGNILSDETLAALLKKEGVEIARRTVAKYREALGIPTSARRKREKRLQM